MTTEGRATTDLQGVAYWLPRDIVTLTVKRAKCDVSISLSDQKRIADPNRKYLLTYDNDPLFRQNTIAIETDSAGLLTSINSTSENQVGAIANQLIDITGSLIKLGVVAKAAECPKPDFERSIVLDPTNKDWSKIQDAYGDKAMFGIITIEDPKDPLAPQDPSAEDPRCGGVDGGVSGICYRVTRAYALRVTLKIDEVSVQKDFRVMAADPHRLFRIPFDPRTFAKFDVTMEFDHGVLKKFKSTDPSAVLAALQIPADVLKGLVGLDTSSSGSSAAAPRTPK